MGLRELLILVLILAIVAVILRGLYVALRARRGQLRMRLDKNVPKYDTEELVISELPNGGARMVERSFAQVVMQNSELSARDRARYVKGESTIPVLMDTVSEDDDEEEEQAAPAPRQSSVASARDAARHKHLQGQTSIKPVHRPIDSLAAQAAATAVPPAMSEAAFADPAEESPESFDDEYADLIAPHSFAATAAQDDDFLEDSDSYAEEAADDEDMGDEDEPAQSDDDDDADDYAEDDYAEDDYADDDEDEDDDDEYADDEDEYAEEQDDDAEEDDDESEDDDVDERADEYENEAAESAAWQDEHYADDALLDYRPVADAPDEPYGEEGVAERAAPAARASTTTAFVDDAAAEDSDGWEEEHDEPAQAAVSAPRRWLKWAGDKLTGMAAVDDEPVHERDFDSDERAEPQLTLESGADVADVAPRQAQPPRPAARASEEVSQPRQPLDRSRQAQLSLDEEEEAYSRRAQEQAEQHSARHSEQYALEPVPVAAAPRVEVRTEPRVETRTEAAAQQPSAPQEYSEVLVINVVAKPDREFTGVDLLPALLSAGLRFGEMSIFHKHVDNKASSPVLFSVANMLNPGTFDLNEVNDFATRGVCFFMTLPNVVTSMQAFERMLDAAQQLRMALDADLKDDVRSVMTAQTIEHYRQRVRDFDLRQLRQPK